MFDELPRRVIQYPYPGPHPLQVTNFGASPLAVEV